MPLENAPQTFTTASDVELAQLALKGVKGAFRAIMQRHNRRLYRIARGIVRNDSEAEDVLQEAYVRAFTHLESFRGEASLGTWLARIVMNEALGQLRRRHQALELTSSSSRQADAQIIQFPFSSASENPERTMAQRQILRLVEQATDKLPEAYRIVFITRVIEGMSVEETAELLGLRHETVKTRLHRARKLLREELESRMGPLLMDAFPFAGQRCERMVGRVFKILDFEE